MPHTVFIKGGNEQRGGKLGDYLQATGNFIISRDKDAAAVVLELPADEDHLEGMLISSGNHRLLLPSSTPRESLSLVIKLLADACDEQRFEKTLYFSLMQRMVRVVGHDIRNPLNNILLATAQFKLESLPDAEETAMYIDIIERSCDRINNLMTEIAEPLSDQALQTDTVSIKEIMEAVALRFKERLEIHNISLKLNIQEDSRLLLDREKMEIALGHILENAIESTKAGEPITISVKKKTGELHLSIRDTGPGIPADSRHKVFYPFFTTKDRKKGLGLTLARKIVQAHGGSLNIKSGEGRGTEAVVCLPLGSHFKGF